MTMLAESYINASHTLAAAAAKMAATRKAAKYISVPSAYTFQSIAFEIFIQMDVDVELLSDLDRRISRYSGEKKTKLFFFADTLDRSATCCRLNAVMLQRSFVGKTFFVFNPRDLNSPEY